VDMGDMVAKDSGQLGRDLYHKGTGKKLTWFNQGSELALRDELNQKYPHGHESANVLLGLRKKASLPAQTKFVNSPGAIGSQTNAPDRVDVMFGIAKRKRIGAGSPVHSLYELILPS